MYAFKDQFGTYLIEIIIRESEDWAMKELLATCISYRLAYAK